MKYESQLKRALVALSLIALIACSKPNCRKWVLFEDRAFYSKYNSGRLILESETSMNYLELEIDRTQSGIRMYLNLFLLPARPLSDDPTLTSIQLVLEDDECLTFYPYLFEGGQRLLLPPEATDFIIKLLLEGHCFTFKVGKNELNVIPDNFQNSYDNLMAIPI